MARYGSFEEAKKRFNPTAFNQTESSQLRRVLLGSLASLAASGETSPIALAQGLYGGPPPSSPTDSGPIELPTIAVEGAEERRGRI